MQHGFARLQGVDDGLAGGVDDLHAVVIGHRKIHPHLAAIRAGHDKHGLPGHGDAAHFFPGGGIDHQHLVPAHGGQVGVLARNGPATQMGHFVHRQRLLAAPVAAQNAAHLQLGRPHIDHGQAIFAKQAGNIGAAIGREQGIVGLLANVGQGGYFGVARIAAIGNANRPGIKQAVHKTPLRQIGQSNDARALAIGHGGGHIGQQLQRGGIKHLDATGGVVLRHNQAAIVADGPADRVARLHHAVGDFLRQEVHAGGGTIAAKNKSIAAIARKYDGCVR